MSSYSWIQAVLAKHVDASLGIDLDGNGTILPNERVQDSNHNKIVGDPKDWEHFLISHADALRRRVAYFQWASSLQRDNPIHDLLSIESEIVPSQDVQNAYKFVENVLKVVRERLSEGSPRNNQEKMKLIYRVIQELGMQFAQPKEVIAALFTTNLKTKVLDCDTSVFIVMAVAHEMGWPVSSVRVPHHFFARWERKGERFNIDAGELHDDAFYVKEYGLSKDVIKAGTYLNSLSPQQVRAIFFMNRGIYKETLGRNEKAITDYDIAIRLDPKNVHAYNKRAFAHLKLSHYEDTVRDCGDAIRLDPKNTITYTNRGIANEELARYEQALRDYSNAIDVDPENRAAYNNRGLLYAKLKRYEEALHDFEALLSIDPNNLDAKNNVRVLKGYLKEMR